jgi:outer membrane protein OmpA-like peptidoglycan-associated protein
MSEAANSRVALLVAVFLALGVIGYLLLGRMGRIEERLGEFGTEMAEIGSESRIAADEAARAAHQSRSALERALEAEASAREAAVGRQQADSRAARAEVTASMANAEALEARRELDRIASERQAEIDRLERALGGVADIRRTPAGLVMSLGSDAIGFDFDDAGLRPTERELLSRIAGVLLTAQGFSVFVYGHTDDVGTDAYNLTLSQRRAEAVRAYLVEAGIDPAIIEAQGFGKSSPRVQGTSAEVRARNRRVEIGIVDVVLAYPTEVPVP